MKGPSPRTFQNHLESKSRSVTSDGRMARKFFCFKGWSFVKGLLQYQDHIKNNALYIQSCSSDRNGVMWDRQVNTFKSLSFLIDDLK